MARSAPTRRPSRGSPPAGLSGNALGRSCSCPGRLFHAVAALCGLRPEVNYERQAAVELEAACDLGERRGSPLPLLDDGGPLGIDARPMIRAVLSGRVFQNRRLLGQTGALLAVAAAGLAAEEVKPAA